MSSRQIILVVACLTSGAAGYAGPIVVIDDKSDFVGQFTVIDFESRGDGTPIALGQGAILRIPSEEYAELGVTITTSSNEVAIVNDAGPSFDAAQSLIGSLPNGIQDGIRHGFLRFDFDPFVNAVGLSTINRTDTDPVILEVFNFSNELLASISFNGSVIDGTIPGAGFGHPFDVPYGFFGAFAPNDAIAYAILTEDATVFDDLHFGVIPEPSTVILLLALIACVRACRGLRNKLPSLAVTLFAGLAPAVFAAPMPAEPGDITGVVTGLVVEGPKPICGAAGWPGCVNPPFTQKPLEGVRVCIPSGQCVYTRANGTYTVPYNGAGNTTVQADLDGQFIRAGRGDADPSGNPVITFSPPLTRTEVPPRGTADFVFNANPNPSTAEGELVAAEVNAFYHATLVRNFYKQRDPEFTGIDQPLTLISYGAPCLTTNFGFSPEYFTNYPPSGPNFGQRCTNRMERSAVAHEYGHFLQYQLGDRNPGSPFQEGVSDALVLLLYDYPFMFENLDGPNDVERNYDFYDAYNPAILAGVRRLSPCTVPQPAHFCGELYAGVWWDLRLNLRDYYYAARPCPIAGLSEDACALEVARRLFVKWLRLRRPADDRGICVDVLRADDNDRNSANLTPHYDQITNAFALHNIAPCTIAGCEGFAPGDCNNNFVKDLCEIANDGSLDQDHNNILDECECPTATINLPASTPPNCTMDARQPHPHTVSSPGALFAARQGIGSENSYFGGPEPITIALIPPVSGVRSTCWGFMETGIEEVDRVAGIEPLETNFISSYAETPAGSGMYRFTLHRPISAGHWTKITYKKDNSTVWYASLPADANKSRMSNAQDITYLINCLNNVPGLECNLYRTDADHSGAKNAQDITGLINLLNGADVFIPWLNKSIPLVSACVGGGVVAESSASASSASSTSSAPGSSFESISPDAGSALQAQEEFTAALMSYLTVGLFEELPNEEVVKITQALALGAAGILSAEEIEALVAALTDSTATFAGPAATTIAAGLAATLDN